MSGSGISWDICKSAPRSRQITTPAPHHSLVLQYILTFIYFSPCALCYVMLWLLVCTGAAYYMRLTSDDDVTSCNHHPVTSKSFSDITGDVIWTSVVASAECTPTSVVIRHGTADRSTVKHTNFMTYKLFFIPDYQFHKVFLCFLR